MAENREETLMKNFVSALNEVFKNDFFEFKKDAYEKISTERFVFLKTVLRNINNIVTLKVTNLFIDKLKDAKIIEESQAKAMKDDVNSISANANGYDVEYPNPKGTNVLVDKPINILAEVKCNIPVEGEKFGANHKKGIKEDIKGLLYGKNKQPINGLENYFKFMVLMDYEYVDEDGCRYSVKESIENLLKRYKEKKKLKLIDVECNELKPDELKSDDVVYIIFISISEDQVAKSS